MWTACTWIRPISQPSSSARAAWALAAGTLLIAAGISYDRDLEKWRAEYQAELRAPDGWLSLAGLYWLHEGDNIVGSGAQSDVVLPQKAPVRTGVLRLRNNTVIWIPAGGVPAKRAKESMNPDIPGPPDVVHWGDIEMTVILRAGKYGARLRDPNTPARRGFTGCRWFPVNEPLRVRAGWRAYPAGRTIPITNILGMTDEEPSPGYAEFTIAGRRLRLEPVKERDHLFFMFRDLTSGKTTYGSGRFLYAAMPKNGVVELDFNKAENPPCAFTPFATCPLPPKQNILPVAIEAGEKRYH
jgi:uncharacterized protein (DUF1684 family)